jgi:adenosylhomocysteinase
LARRSASPDEHRRLVNEFLDTKPEFLIDDGSHVIRYAHEHRPDVFEHLIGAAEETTSGLRPLRTMAEQGALRIPVIAVNDARSKTLFDNRYGTGQSCVFAILDLVPTDLRRATAVVIGFGDVGAGVAHHLRALGATVVVVEKDAVRALQATFDGYEVRDIIGAAAVADLLVSATGVPNTITVDALRGAKDDCIVAVAGGVEQEVALDAAVAAGAELAPAGRDVETLTFPGGASTRILSHGGCINVTAAEGNPIDIMDLSFAVQLQAVRQFFESDPPSPGVYPLRDDLDREVAAIALGREPEAPNETNETGDWHTTRFGKDENNAG